MEALKDQLVSIEKLLWKNDTTLYNEHLVEEALLVFAETGVISKQTAINAIKEENATGRRWAEVEFADVQLLQLSETSALITYKATARWEGETDIFNALCTSIYVKRDEGWKLTLHQQSALVS